MSFTYHFKKIQYEILASFNDQSRTEMQSITNNKRSDSFYLDQ